MNIESLLQYRDKEYFDQKPNDTFLFYGLGIIKISKLELCKGLWYFKFSNAHEMGIKAITTKCISMREIIGLKIHFIDRPDITGVFGGKETSWGLIHTSFIYTYWDRLQSVKQPSMYALTHIHDLKLIE